jgi:hypothetical protein
LAYCQKVGKEAGSTDKGLCELSTVEELRERFMVAVSDLWRATDELIEKFTPLLNLGFNIRK